MANVSFEGGVVREGCVVRDADAILGSKVGVIRNGEVIVPCLLLFADEDEVEGKVVPEVEGNLGVNVVSPGTGNRTKPALGVVDTLPAEFVCLLLVVDVV